MTETRPRRRRRWVVPALLLVGAGALIARRSAARPADDVWAPATRPAPSTATAAPVAEVSSVEAPRSAGSSSDESPGPAGDQPDGPVPASAPDPGPSATAGATSNGRSPAVPLAAAPPAVTAATTSPRRRRTAPLPPAAAAAGPDGEAPGPEFTIKGNAGSKLFHPPSSPYYARTKAEVWFRTAEDAEAAGFTAYRPRGPRT